MSKKEEIAKAAQEANPKDWTIDELFDAILESTRKTGVGMVHAIDGTLKIQSYDFKQIYGDYASAIGKESLTQAERQQALLNHVLEQGIEGIERVR